MFETLKSKFVLIVLIFGVFSIDAIFSQSKEETIRVTVTDSKFRYVTDLTKQDFNLKVDGVSQEILSVSSGENEPLSVLILIDNSASTKQYARKRYAQAAFEFIQKSNPRNDYAIFEFGNDIRESADWGISLDQLIITLRSFGIVENPLGRTALYSAIIRSVKKLESAKNNQKVILLLSDVRIDDENGQIVTTAKDALRNSNIVVYGISNRELQPNFVGMRVQTELFDLAAITGGKFSFPQTTIDSTEVIERIATENKSFYLLNYIPKDTAGKPDLKKLSVSISKEMKKVGEFIVQTRPKLHRVN